jgi:carbamoyl-phosphate synthase large subunit
MTKLNPRTPNTVLVVTRDRQTPAGTGKGKRPKMDGRQIVPILFTCVGRRVSLLKSFRRAAGRLKITAPLLGADTTELSPALQLCDKGFLVKPVTHRDYIGQLLTITKKHRTKLLIPTVDWDLKLLSANKSKFARLGCRVLVSELGVVDICQDKRKTYLFLTKNGFDTPWTISASAARRRKALTWPVFLKRWDGSASKGNAIAQNRSELAFFAKNIPNAICQEFINGIEHTCDVYVDFDMKVRCVVPRKRIQVRSGEVSKGQIVKDHQVMTQAASLVQKLGAGPGVITLQLFLTKNNKVKFIEINPRFGGGVPLSVRAGANFPKWILTELLGRKPAIRFDGFKDNLVMLRYDAEVWLGIA